MPKTAKQPKRVKREEKRIPYEEESSYFPLHPRVRDILFVILTGILIYLLLSFFTTWAGYAGYEFKESLFTWFGKAAYFSVFLPILMIVFLLDSSRTPSWLHLGYLAVWFISLTLFFDLLNLGGNSAVLIRPLIKFFGEGGTFIFSLTLLLAATVILTNISLQTLLHSGRLAFIFSFSLLKKLQQPKTVPVPVHISTETEEDTPESASPVIVEQLPQEEPKAAEDHPAETEKPEPEEAAESKKPLLHPVFTSTKSKRKSDDLKGYKIPALTLLETPKKEKGLRIEPSDYSRVLEETLRSFGVEATVTHVERGPTVTRYEMQPAKGVKVSKIVSLTDDLALALAATSLRIEAPIPGKSAIGIEVPNSSVAMVYFRDMLSSKVYRESPHKMLLALGKDIAGTPIYTDLRKMPHLLIAGATGSGKTVCINTLIASILFKATPHEVQFIMIDPKRVELTIYDGIPHLIQEVVTDPKQAAKTLLDVLAIMDERYNSFKEARVRNLEEYNKAKPETPLPYIVVLIDELADLMTLAAATVETSISRLTALARAAGIHLIVATQRPSVDVITGIIKANIPSRVAFAVSSMVDSRTILDTGGAEKLLGRGDMLFAPIDAMKPLRLQGAYVGLSEIEALVSFWSQQAAPDNLVQFPITNTELPEGKSQNDGDELYGEAKETILRTGQASVSTLQRKLKIGYARAGRLMDLLEQDGIVSAADGAKPRKILIPNPFKTIN